MGAAGEAVAAAVAGCGIHLFKPVPRLAHHGVALSGMDLHAMAHRQVAQPQQLGDWYGIGAGQASAALAAEAGPQLLASLLILVGVVWLAASVTLFTVSSGGESSYMTVPFFILQLLLSVRFQD